jgi:hypothetical protein
MNPFPAAADISQKNDFAVGNNREKTTKVFLRLNYLIGID